MRYRSNHVLRSFLPSLVKIDLAVEEKMHSKCFPLNVYRTSRVVSRVIHNYVEFQSKNILFHCFALSCMKTIFTPGNKYIYYYKNNCCKFHKLEFEFEGTTLKTISTPTKDWLETNTWQCMHQLHTRTQSNC